MFSKKRCNLQLGNPKTYKKILTQEKYEENPLSLLLEKLDFSFVMIVFITCG